MRALIAAAFIYIAAAFGLTAGTKSVHHSETVSRGETRSLTVMKTDDDYFAKWERDGKRYVTRDASVLAEIEAALAGHRRLSQEHAALGRRHAELGREHAQLGREHARVGRQMARVGHSEARQRELERTQQNLERQQAKLEERQEELERLQHELERRQEPLERDADRKLDAIFDRAVRAGKATRD